MSDGSPASGCDGPCTQGVKPADGTFAFVNVPARTFTVSAVDAVSGLKGAAGGRSMRDEGGEHIKRSGTQRGIGRGRDERRNEGGGPRVMSGADLKPKEQSGQFVELGAMNHGIFFIVETFDPGRADRFIG